MINYNDGKIHGWNGGDCPVHPNTVVHCWLRSASAGKEEAGELEWKHRSDINMLDIIAFQVVKEYKEPKTIWVNEYKTGPLAYNTKEEAETFASRTAMRNVVKYVEAQE